MPTATSDLERVTPNIYTTTRLRGCNPSFVDDLGRRGRHRHAAAADAGRGDARRGRVARPDPLPHQHRAPRRPHLRQLLVQGRAGRQPPGRCTTTSWSSTPDLDPYAYALEAIPTDDPEAAPIVPDRDTYYADPNKGTIVFTGDLTLRVGDHTFRLLHTPGHTPGQLAVHVPEERAVFTGDTIFSELPDVADDVERRPVARGARADPPARRRPPDPGPRPGHRRSSTSRPSGRCCSHWKAAVADAVAKGWTREETIARVRFDERSARSTSGRAT